MVLEFKKTEKEDGKKPIGSTGNVFAELSTNQSTEEALIASSGRTDNEQRPLKLFNSYLGKYHTNTETIPIEGFVKELEKFIRTEDTPSIVFTALKNNSVVIRQLKERVAEYPSFVISIIKTAISKKDPQLITFLIEILKPVKMKPILNSLFEHDLNNLLFQYVPAKEQEQWCQKAMIEGKPKIATQKELIEIDNFLENEVVNLLEEKRINGIIKFLERREPLWRANPEKFTYLYRIIKARYSPTNKLPWEILDFWFNAE